MKLRMPEYYKQFKCIADKCKDSCCSAGWEIDIDDDTAKLYDSVSGEFGEKLHKSIDNSCGNRHFILDEHNNCPFLKDGLCEIFTELGEHSLCKICSEHPRYYEWFTDLKEGGIGLCCEEAARIILSFDKKFTTYDVNDDESDDELDTDSDDYDEDLYTFLNTARNKIIAHLEDNSIDFNNRIRDIIWYGNVLQQDIDFNLLDDEEIVDVTLSESSNLIDIFDFLCTLELNDNNWSDYLKDCSKVYTSNYTKLGELETKHPEVNDYLKNIAIYFIWRYFLKGCFDEDVLSKIKLMAVSVSIIRAMIFCKWLDKNSIKLEDCVDIVKKYSEEIEYCEDNLLKFFKASYELEAFNVEKIIGLFK